MKGRFYLASTAKKTITTKQVKRKPKQLTKVKPIDAKDIRTSFYCVTCGKEYTEQKKNFSYSQSPLFRGNNCYLPICNHCLDNITEQYADLLSSEENALKRVCMKFDIYINDSIIATAMKANADESKIKKIIRQSNLRQNKDKTYDTYLNEIKNYAIDTPDGLDAYMQSRAYETPLDDSDKDEIIIAERSREEKKAAVEKGIELFGMGYYPDEYIEMLNHYKLLKAQTDDDDTMQDIYIKEACEKHILKMRCRDDVDKFDKMSKSYTQTVKEANLKKSVKNEVNESENTWGNFIEIIEKYTPDEYYKDKDIFADYDKFGEYYDRHIGRPTDNLLNGTLNLDPEYSIKDDDTDGNK